MPNYLIAVWRYPREGVSRDKVWQRQYWRAGQKGVIVWKTHGAFSTRSAVVCIWNVDQRAQSLVPHSRKWTASLLAFVFRLHVQAKFYEIEANEQLSSQYLRLEFSIITLFVQLILSYFFVYLLRFKADPIVEVWVSLSTHNHQLDGCFLVELT